jgi:hypothetical protein
VLSDRDGEKRRKPRGAFSAIVWSYAGDVPPANVRDWQYVNQTTRTINRLIFDAHLPPGAKVWLTACWMNSRGKQGRPCEPVMTHVGGGLGGMMLMQNIKSARMLYVKGLPRFPRVRHAGMEACTTPLLIKAA